MICSFFAPAAVAQNLEETLKFADFQFELGNYQLALKEYQRVLFFNNEKNLQYIYEQVGSTFFYQKDYKKAAHYYELSFKTTDSDSLKTELIFKKATCLIFNKNYKLAGFELLNLSDSLDFQYSNKKNFYLAVCYWGMEDFEKAKNSFLEILPNENKSATEEINLLFRKKRNLHRPNPKTAKLLSIFIPGSGQIYSSDLKNGINSFVLTGVFVAIGIYMTQFYSIFDAVLTSIPWFMRYHKGGYRAAHKIAQQKRDNRRNETYQEVLKIIKQNSTKKKTKAKEGN